MTDQSHQNDHSFGNVSDRLPQDLPKNPPKFRLRELFAKQKFLWLLAWLLGVATVLSVLGLTMTAGWFVTLAGVAGLTGFAVGYLVLSAMIRHFALLRTLARYGDLMVSHHAVFDLLKTLRVRFFSWWANLPIAVRHAQKSGSGDVMQRLVKDIDTLDEFPLRVVSPMIVATVAVMVMVLFILLAVPTAFVASMFLVMALFVAVLTLKKGVALARRESELLTLRQGKLLHALPALTALLTWGRWTESVRELSRYDQQHHALNIQVLKVKRHAQAFIQISIAVAVAVLLLIVGRVFEQGMVPLIEESLRTTAMITPAMVLALALGVFGLMEVVAVLAGEPLAYGRSLIAKERINGLLAVQSSPVKQVIGNDPTLTLRHLSVKMPSAIIGAEGINATLGTNRPTLIIGASGAGKSTLLATLAGEIPRVCGEILVGGVSIDEVAMGQAMGFLGQNVDIFDQTLADNLRLGKPDASDDELWAVLEKVNLAHWAKQQPKGLDTPLGEYGMAISGGQGRRVALARLLLSPKKILLLDEPFAGLDSTTRQVVWNALIAMQQQGDIGVLAIATHQIWDGMGEVDILTVG